MPRTARMPPPWTALLALGLSAFASNPAVAASVDLTLTPGPGSLSTGQTTLFSATLSGARKEVVLWSVCNGNRKKCVPNGNPLLGTIYETGGAGGGVHTATYSAPGTTPGRSLCTPVPGGCRITLRAKAKHAPAAYADLVIGDFLRVATDGLPAGFSGEPYDAILVAAGGTPPYSWSVTGLPAGLLMDPATGAVTGTLGATPATASHPVGVSVTDSTAPPQSATAILTLGVSPLLDPSFGIDSPHDGVAGQPFTLIGRTAGGRPPVSAALAGGAVPTGLTLNLSTLPTVLLTGTPVQAGDWLIDLGLSDSSDPPRTGTARIAVTIRTPLQIPPADLPAALRDEPYAASLQASGGTPPYSFGLGTGLPLGLVLDPATGSISGTPQRVFNGAVYVNATDSGRPPQTAQAPVNLKVTGPLKFVDTKPTPAIFVVDYFETLQVDGGKPPFAFDVVAGALPPGVNHFANLSALALYGLPVQPGAWDFTIHAADSSVPPATVDQALSLFVRPAPLSIANRLLPAGAVGVPYSSFLSAGAGYAPLRWSLAAGSLPLGLALDPATGEIGGTPSAAGAAAFTVRLSDSLPPLSAEKPFVLDVRPAAPGRNDSIATATPLPAGGYQGLSLSGPAGGTDTDYYRLTADGGSLVVVQAAAAALSPPSPADTVIELLRDDGTRFTTCLNPGLDDGVTGAPDPTPFDFDDPCLNDDTDLGAAIDSHLSFLVPGTGVVTFYLHVLDYYGGSRPDLLYDLAISGAH